jgi:outer membrane receptor protein involved in Fe transport
MNAGPDTLPFHPRLDDGQPDPPAGGDRRRIRDIRAGDRSNSGTSRGVRILVNSIPETEPDGRTSFDGIDLASAEGIEVVRSNASALWGNAAGGVVNVNTIPSFSLPFFEEDNVVRGFGLRRFALKGGTLFGSARAIGAEPVQRARPAHPGADGRGPLAGERDLPQPPGTPRQQAGSRGLPRQVILSLSFERGR